VRPLNVPAAHTPCSLPAIALPPGAAGGSYLGLAVPAPAGDGDGTRTDADAAECRDAEQEQVGTGGGQAAARRRAGAHRRGGAAGPALLTGGVPSTKRNLNITKSTHGAQNADLSNAPEIESRPLWRRPQFRY
jgi:hypothetical protein